MALATALALVLVNPVGGGVAAGFDISANPYAPGQHRGADLRAAPTEPVRAACGGRVVVAGRVGSSGRLVTVRCGRWRVTHMPLATIAVRAGAVIPRGARLGTVGRSDDHAGLHLGVRREGRRFGYVDPVPLFSAPPRLPPPPAPPSRRPRRPIAERHPPAPRAAPARRVVAARPGGLAPWPAWAGLALVLAGVGIRVRMRVAASLPRPPWRSTSPPRSTT
jgi:Peptidase family M23